MWFLCHSLSLSFKKTRVYLYRLCKLACSCVELPWDRIMFVYFEILVSRSAWQRVGSWCVTPTILIENLWPAGYRTRPFIRVRRGTSLVVQWSRIGPPADAGDISSILGPGRCHMPQSKLSWWATAPGLACLEPVLHIRRSPHDEKPTGHSWAVVPAHHN